MQTRLRFDRLFDPVTGGSRLFNPVFRSWDEVGVVKATLFAGKPKGYLAMLHRRTRQAEQKEVGHKN